MSWMTRNIITIMLGAATSLTTVATLLYLEGSIGLPLFGISGQTIFGGPLLAFIPVGAIFAGFLGSLGFLASSLALRNRPALVALVGIVGISAGVVYLAESAELEYYIGAQGTTRDAATFGRFLAVSMFHSRLYEWSLWQGGEAGESMAALLSSGASSSGVRLRPTGDAKADGIGAGVQGVMAAQDLTQSGPGRQLTEMSHGVDTLGTIIRAHRRQWFMLSLQIIGFALGGVLAFFHLRSVTYCKDCMLLLSKKGEQTRYFSRARDMRSSVDEVLTKARDKQLQQAIQAHLAKGANRDGNWSEYCSTLEIQRCLRCRTHVLDFRTKHKQEKVWKPIEVLAFSATTAEQLDFA
jgi:hypothetical protein